MKKSLLAVVSLCLVFVASDAFARPFARDCPRGANAERHLRDVVNFMRTHMNTVRGLFESGRRSAYHPRKGADRRVRRRLRRGRKLDNIWFACAKSTSPLCKNADGRHFGGAASNKIRICYNDILRVARRTPGRGFCHLLELVSHEFGHAVGIKKDEGAQHTKRQRDRVYQWGRTWSRFCRDNGHDRNI